MTLLGHVRAAYVLAVFFSTGAAGILVQAILLAIGHPYSRRFPFHYFSFFKHVLGYKLEIRGKMLTSGPLLIASNHIGYFDIPVIGALGPLIFTAKSDVKKWFFFGLGAAVCRAIFIHRSEKRRSLPDRDEMERRLRAGEIVVLFPEGTSSDGGRVLPFKSTLMSVCELDLKPGDSAPPPDHVLRVQPMSIAYTRLAGMPLDRHNRPLLAWYGDMTLIPHLWKALATGPFDVVVEFHAPVTVAELGNRKVLARHCETVVRQGMMAALTGAAGEARYRARPAQTSAGESRKAAALPVGQESHA